MASSSSTIDSCNNYDVFLSFRGDDTRNNFTSHLYEALCGKKINAFIDYNIKRGDEITRAIERVIEGAKISIIVFSPDYASSTFCLDELVKIMECKESKQQIVLPIFYKVEPSEKAYQESFKRHMPSFGGNRRRREEINKQVKVKKWKSAFRKALELAGWPIDAKCNEAEEIKNIISNVLANLKKSNHSRLKGEELITTPIVGQTAEANLEKVWNHLMYCETSRVAIYGMGGIGKTTIATHINNKLGKHYHRFNHIYWVTVSKDSSTYKLQRNIAKAIGIDFSGEDDVKKRAATLRENLKDKKFVLILDDVWEAFEIEEVGIPLLVSGQKLLLTTRSYQVCRSMECESIEVKSLSKKEAMELFMKESNNQIINSHELRDIVHSILEECGGLPLAIVVVARTMRGVAEISKWRNTLRELQKPCEGENNEMEKKVYKPLKFSYDCLPNNKYRQCFLYCSLFPEDHKFRRNDLIEYLIGEGLINELDSKQAELDKGNVILDELIHSSLLENDKYGWIKMHDVIRDMALINVKVGLQFEDPLERVQVLHKIVLKSSPQHSKLKTLVLQDVDLKELSGCFFANKQSLTVLHMKDVKSVPISITKLGNLKVLISKHCHHCIPSLAGLEKLRHLEISHNLSLKEIPKDIERLINLRVLDLSGCNFLSGSFPSGVVEKLSHLQTLDLCGRERVEVEPQALVSLEKLEILRVCFNDLHKLNCYLKSEHWRRLLNFHICYREYSRGDSKKGMHLAALRDVEEWKGEFGIFLPDNIQIMFLKNWESPMFDVLKNPTFPDLETLFFGYSRIRCLFTDDLLQRLIHTVQNLEIFHCYELEEIIATDEEEWEKHSNYTNYPTIVLPNLKTLKLYFLRELRSIYRGKVFTPSLDLIQIHDCDKLQRLPFYTHRNRNERIQIESIYKNEPLSGKWWYSLKWDNPDDSYMYRTKFYVSDYE